MSAQPGAAPTETPRTRRGARPPVDWAALDGAEYAVEDEFEDDGQWRRRTVTRYVLLPDHTGRRTIERRQVDTIESRARGGAWSMAAIERMRTIMYVDGPGFRTEHRLDPISVEDPPTSTRAVFEDTVLRLDLGDQVDRRASSAEYLIGPEMLAAAVAALPDSLPRVAYFWSFRTEGNLLEPEPVQIEFGAPREVDVPFAPPGASCAASTPVHLRPAAVVQVTVRRGTTTQRFHVLARRPHLAVSGAVRCIRLPGDPAP